MKKIFSYLTWSRARIAAEYVALILLMAHLLPESFIEKWKENGLVAMILLGACLIMALSINIRDRRKMDAETMRLTSEFQSNVDKMQQEIGKLKRSAVYTDIFKGLR